MRLNLGKFVEPSYALMRIVIGFLFACHGSQALLNIPAGEAHQMSTLILVGKVIELVGGVLIMVGFMTSVSAFISSGQMAYAYWFFHAKGSMWPLVNQGEPAVVYCFVLLYLAAKGSGVWSIDSLRRWR